MAQHHRDGDQHGKFLQEIITMKNAEEAASPRLLSYKEAGQILGVTGRTVWNMVDRGDLPAVRFGGNVRIDPADLDSFINEAWKTRRSGSDNNSEGGNHGQ